MGRCIKHGLPMDESLHSCWRCVSAERDPPDTGASWWWIRLPHQCRCRVPIPSPEYEYCMRCGLFLRQLAIARAA